MLFQLDLPKLNTDDLAKLFQQAFDKIKDPWIVQELVSKMNEPQYLCWDKIKHKPRPGNLTAEEVWVLVKLSRQLSMNRSISPVRTPENKKFTWQTVPWMQQFFHEVDLNLGGELMSATSRDVLSRQRIISRGIMEEAIASSQLEGAATTRKVAKQMIQERRKPRNRSERMILNNYNAMMLIDERLRQTEMSVDQLLELHEILTKDTIGTGQTGAFRKNTDDVVVADPSTGAVFHKPPSRQFVDEQISALLEYSNDRNTSPAFEHPLVKAVFIHFWIGYLHPFVDGNGRIARALFYWYMLRKNYWAFAYLPISRVIRQSPAQYRDAYIYSEQDDYDLTYFLDYNIRKVKQARESFTRYIEYRHEENARMAEVVNSRFGFGERQVQLLRYFYKNAGASTTISTHSHLNGVSRLTGRRDLEQLEEAGFLNSRKLGRERVFTASDKLATLFETR